MHHDEVDLNACVTGDGDAWGTFVDRCSGVIYAAVHRTMGGGHHASIEDVVQDVFIRLIRNDYRLLRSYDPGRAALTTWLTLIARSVAIDHLRKKRVPTLALGQLDGTTTPVAPELVVEAAMPDVPRHVLSERQALVLGMLFDEGLTVPEAARRLGVNEQTIRSTKHKGLSRLREHMSSPEIEQVAGDVRPDPPVQPSGGDHV